MALLDEIPHGERIERHRPWPRAVVGEDGWHAGADRLASGKCTLLGLWGDQEAVHMALMADTFDDIAVLTYACKEGRYPSIGSLHPPALRLERAIRDLSGHDATYSPDARPWLDHGAWQGGAPTVYDFLPAEGEGLHQIPVGPVHAGIIEPGHFRFTANGEHVVRLEQRLGYVHKGIEKLMEQAAEAAMQVTPPPRAIYLRALMAELERLANHFGDIGAICNDAAFALMHAQTGILRERVLRAAEACFGHRLMMDVIVPGGVACDIADDGARTLRALLAEAHKVFPRLIELYDNTASLQDRTVTTGIVRADYARQFGAGGYVGRASGRGFDARRHVAYAPYGDLKFDVPVR
ncbi:MAG: hydrogenase expression protein HypE, partial [Pseudolabrys sp.]